MLIYKITNRENGKVYVGQTRRKRMNRRWNEHVSHASKGSPLYFHRAIRKYGPEAFKVEVIDRAETSEELAEKERLHIALCDSNNGENGYNLTLGGEGTFGYKRSPEQIEAMRKRQLGCSPSMQAREKSSGAHKEIWGSRSAEEKTKILAHLKTICSDGGRSLKGRRRTLQERLAISRGRKGIGRPQSDEVKQKIANTLRGRKRPVEVIQKMVATKQLKKMAAAVGE